ncbi:MAG TPA: hypothetical protein VN205_03770 [Thermomonas sp.]|nr:hypothetical protein [Thermomonas sp.]
MKSIQHVLWRGALALSLMAVGVGTGLGMPPAEQAASAGDCPVATRGLLADELPRAREQGARVLVLRRSLSPAG